MADNSQADVGAGGDVFATDDIAAGPTGAAKWPFAKLAWGALDTAEVVDDAAGKRVPVKVGEALPAGTNNIGDVDVATLPALPAGANNIGDVDVVTVPAPLNVVGGGTQAAALRVTVASDSTGVLSVDDNGGSLTVDGPLTDTQLRAAAVPVSLPTPVLPEPPVVLNATASGDTTVIAAPGAGVNLFINKVSVHNRGAATIVVAFTDGAAGTVRWRAELAVEGGGSLIDFGPRGWKLTANTALVVNLATAGDVDVNVTEHYVTQP